MFISFGEKHIKWCIWEKYIKQTLAFPYLKSVDKCGESSLCLECSHIQVCDQINHPNSSCHKLLQIKKLTYFKNTDAFVFKF